MPEIILGKKVARNSICILGKGVRAAVTKGDQCVRASPHRIMRWKVGKKKNVNIYFLSRRCQGAAASSSIKKKIRKRKKKLAGVRSRSIEG